VSTAHRALKAMAGRLQGLCRLARLAGQSVAQAEFGTGTAAASLQQTTLPAALSTQLRSLQLQFSRSFASGAANAPTTDIEAEYEHATGLEKQEIEATLKGKLDPWHEDWLDAPFGTPDAPVEVPSSFSHRVVGVPDPDDDSLVWWGIIEADQPPKQIIEGGEYFVLVKDPDADESHGHH